jgi:hypothetical protein
MDERNIELGLDGKDSIVDMSFDEKEYNVELY